MKKIQLMGAALLISASSVFANAAEISAKDFAKLSPKEAIEQAHEWRGKNYAMVAVTPNGIEATFKDNQQVVIPLQDEFFVSIAPYENKTHDCSYHVPTGCTGEMMGKKIQLKITDQKTGVVIKDEQIEVQKDGFVDLWLPKDKEFLIEFDYKDKKASQIIPTGKNDLTCITTMQLKK
ncbi:MAG: CueP family metal-binding protein [Alphaproteobacteria bacterium]